MNIKSFKEGDIITRNAPCKYVNHQDSSFCGTKMKFLGIDETAKVFFVQFMDGHSKDDTEPYTFSYALYAWDEGWASYPTSLFESAKALINKRFNK